MSEKKEVTGNLKDDQTSAIKEDKYKGNGKALKVISLRNAFFYMFYRHSILVFVTSIIGFALSLFFMVFYSQKPVSPQYIAIKEDGRYIEVEKLSECKKREEVQNFVVQALKKTNKYDFINYPEQIQEASAYFTTEGWNSYLTSFKESKTLDAIKEMQGISSIVIDTIPEIKKEGLNENQICSWEVEANGVLTYYGNGKVLTNNYRFLIRVVRNSVMYSPSGLGVSTLITQIK